MRHVTNFLKDIRKSWMCWLMLLPGLVCVIIWGYIPMIGLVMAFQKLDLKKGVFTSPFVGFDNFKFLFASSDAWIITRNTVCYQAVFIATTMFCAVGLAVIINELRNRLFSKVTQTILIMPHFLSAVVVSTILFAFLSPTNGYVNGILKEWGFSPVNWYNTKAVWPPLLVVVRLWMSVGYSSIIYVAVLSGISEEYYEAALIDGATKLQQFRFITLPELRFIISIQLIRSMGSLFKAGIGMFYTIPRDSGALYPVTNVLDTYIYRSLLQMNNFGMTTAAGLYQSVVGMILVLIANKIVTKIESDAALF